MRKNDFLVYVIEDSEDERVIFDEASMIAKDQLKNPKKSIEFKYFSDYAEFKHELEDNGNNFKKLPSIIITDLFIGQSTGFDVLKFIKESELKFIPVIVLSSTANDEDLRKAYDMRSNSFLVKPADFNEFVDQIRSLLDFWIKTKIRTY